MHVVRFIFVIMNVYTQILNTIRKYVKFDSMCVGKSKKDTRRKTFVEFRNSSAYRYHDNKLIYLHNIHASLSIFLHA